MASTDTNTKPLGGAEPVPRDGYAAALAEARERTLALVAPVSEDDLDRVHDAADEPAGLGPRPHRRLRGPLAVLSGPAASSRCEPDLMAVYDASETPRAERGDIPYLRRDDALELHGGGARARAGRARERDLSPARTGSTPTASSGTCWSSTSTSTTRRCCRRCSSPRRASTRRERDAAADADGPTRGGRGIGSQVARAGPVRDGRSRGDGLRLRQRAPAHRVELPRVRDRPRAGDQRRLRRVRGGRRLRAPRAVERGGLGVARAARASSGRSTGPATAASAASTAPSRSSPALPVMHVSWYEADAYARWARRAAADRGRVGEGGRAPTASAAAATSTSSTSGPGAAGPVRRRLLGVDGERASTATPASGPSRTASTRRSSSAPATACCAAPRGRRGRASRAPPSATGTSPQRRQIFCRLPLRSDSEGRNDSGDHDRALRARRRTASLPTRCATASPRAEGAAAEVLLRRARLGAVRPRSPRCPSTTPRAASARSSTAARRRSSPRRARPSWSSSARAWRRRRARCCTRWPAPGRCAATCRSTSTRRWSSSAPTSWPSSTRASPCTAWSATSSATSTSIPAGRAPAVRVPRRDDRQPLPGRARSASSRALRELMGPDRPAADRHRPGEGPRRDRGRLQRQRGRDRRVQPQRAARAQPRARRRLRPRRRSSTSPSSTRRTRGSRCGCARTGAQTVTIDGADLDGGVRRRRGDAHRDQRQVHARRGRARAGRRGPAARRASTPTTAACSGSRLGVGWLIASHRVPAAWT